MTTIPRASRRSVFIAGPMQESRDSTELCDQTYREAIREMVLKHHPHASIYCPLRALKERFAATEQGIREAFRSLHELPIVMAAALPSEVAQLTDFFRAGVAEAERSDVVIAYVGEDVSMGTAIEIWAAKGAGALTVIMTTRRQSLALLASADVLVSSLAQLEKVLSPGGIAFERLVR